MNQPLETKAVRHQLIDNLNRVKSNIVASAERVGRDPNNIKLIVVTKTVDLDIIRLLLELGELELGENRVQQLTQRAAVINEQRERSMFLTGTPSLPEPHWHMIGHLQRNKVKQLLPVVTLIHSVDNLRLAEEINNRAKKIGKVQDILVQVNCSNEPQKFGLPIPATVHFVEQILTLSNIKVRGLMTMAAIADDPEKTRPTFDMLYELFLEVKMELRLGKEFSELSMGMSQDYTVAVECGATMVRIGSAIFQGIPTLNPE